MIQRPPACERHAAELPGKALIVPPEDCPWCWAEEREKAAAPPSEKGPGRSVMKHGSAA